MQFEKRHLLTIALPIAIIAAVCVRPAQAMFFDVVFDPSAYATLGKIWSEDISTGAKLIKEYNQLVKIYTTGENLYQSAMYMRQSFSSGMRASWLTTAQIGVNNYTQSKYGETAAWPQVLNGYSAQAPSAWASATMPVVDTGAMMGTLNPDLQRRLQSRLASIEIADGSGVQCLQTLGQQHANSNQNMLALSSLTKAFLSSSSQYNSLIQQLNLTNAHQQAALNEGREQSAMQNCIVAQQLAHSKIERDNIADGINGAIRTQAIVADPQYAWDGKGGWSVDIP